LAPFALAPEIVREEFLSTISRTPSISLGGLNVAKQSSALGVVVLLLHAEATSARPGTMIGRTMNIDSFFDRIPQWLKSLHEMENELRNAARHGLILRKEGAAEHLAQARRHLQDALGEAKGLEPPNGPQTPLRKEGEV
jgi:hypothetical protein